MLKIYKKWKETVEKIKKGAKERNFGENWLNSVIYRKNSERLVKKGNSI